ncbi:MAG: GNAT family N-acetyltransferase [Gammaproteobacteria bacterium]|nr:GNAT family N-acetyltransferase [Gammaproteobacteria bacterium]
MEIRQAKSGDERGLIDLFDSLYQESDFLLMEPGESEITINSQAEIIGASLQSSSQVLFVAVEGAKIVGFLGGAGGKVNRNRHSIHIAMGVLAESQGKGIGRQLLSTFIDWSESNQFHRIELSVMEHNVRAKSLYEKMGFQTEGLKYDSLKVNGRYINEYFMAKFICA